MVNVSVSSIRKHDITVDPEFRQMRRGGPLLSFVAIPFAAAGLVVAHTRLPATYVVALFAVVLSTIIGAMKWRSAIDQLRVAQHEDIYEFAGHQPHATELAHARNSKIVPLLVVDASPCSHPRAVGLRIALAEALAGVLTLIFARV